MAEGLAGKVQVSTNTGEPEGSMVFDSPRTFRPRSNIVALQDESKFQNKR